MENTYQDLITDIQSKNPKISGKLEGGKKFKIKSDFKPAGDQPEAIKKLVNGANKEEFNQVLLGVTGSGKTFTMAKVIEASITFAMVKVFPDPVTPNNTWLNSSLFAPLTSFFIASGWSPAGLKSDLILNFLPPSSFPLIFGFLL